MKKIFTIILIMIFTVSCSASALAQSTSFSVLKSDYDRLSEIEPFINLIDTIDNYFYYRDFNVDDINFVNPVIKRGASHQNLTIYGIIMVRNRRMRAKAQTSSRMDTSSKMQPVRTKRLTSQT